MKQGIFFEPTKSGFGGVYLFYQGGGRYEKAGFRGISHLAEHLKCKGHDKFKREFNFLALDWNAMTGDEFVGFYCAGLEEKIAGFSARYLEAVTSYIPTKEEFESEKEIVQQELVSALSNDTLPEAYSRAKFNYYGAIGSSEDLKALSYKDFLKFYKNMYGNPTTIVFSGAGKMKKVFENLKTTVKTKAVIQKKQVIVVNKKPDEKQFSVWSNKDATTLKLFSVIQDKSLCAQYSFLFRLLGDGLYSPLYQEIRETKKLCYYLRLNLNRFEKNIKVVEFDTETEKIEEVKNSLFEILENFEKYVSKEYFADYVEKYLTEQKKFVMKGGFNYALVKYFSEDDSLFYTYAKNSPLFSYEAMKTLSDKIADKKNWESVIHKKDKIIFTDKV